MGPSKLKPNRSLNGGRQVRKQNQQEKNIVSVSSPTCRSGQGYGLTSCPLPTAIGTSSLLSKRDEARPPPSPSLAGLTYHQPLSHRSFTSAPLSCLLSPAVSFVSFFFFSLVPLLLRIHLTLQTSLPPFSPIKTAYRPLAGCPACPRPYIRARRLITRHTFPRRHREPTAHAQGP